MVILREIEALCQTGATTREIATQLGIDLNRTNRDLGWLMKRGRIFPAGMKGRRRYFSVPPTPEQLAIVEADDEAHRVQAAKIKKAKRLARDRKQRQKQAPKGVTKYTVIRTEKKPAPVKRVQQIVIPQGLKVTICPPCQLDRFKFDPPEGWRGQITRDWLDRRLRG